MAEPRGLTAFLQARNMTLWDVPAWALGTFVAFLWAMPFFWMVSTSFKLPEHVMTETIEWIPRVFTWNIYIKVFEFPILR